MALQSFVFLRALIMLSIVTIGFSASLSTKFYDKVCPQALPTIKRVVEEVVSQERRMGASLLRLHFHDCFVNGCDASVLLDATPTMESEKDALPNVNSARGFDIIDRIKGAVDKVCRQPIVSCADILAVAARDSVVAGCDASVLLDATPTMESEKDALPNVNSARGFDIIDRIKGTVDKVCRQPIVSCADILAVAARDSVVALGGPSWKVELGRRDSTTAASIATTNTDLPSPFMDLPALISSFSNKGLNVKDLVALSGGHVVGFAKCQIFRFRIHNETNIDQNFARQLQTICPQSGSNGNLAPLDQSPDVFDTKYFGDLVKKRGLMHSDQVLFNGGSGPTDNLVKTYSKNFRAFSKDFGDSMIKMGRIKPLTGKNGQVRVLCRQVNH